MALEGQNHREIALNLDIKNQSTFFDDRYITLNFRQIGVLV
ncbi:hypothetical protein [Nostoc sp.]